VRLRDGQVAIVVIELMPDAVAHMMAALDAVRRRATVFQLTDEDVLMIVKAARSHASSFLPHIKELLAVYKKLQVVIACEEPDSSARVLAAKADTHAVRRRHTLRDRALVDSLRGLLVGKCSADKMRSLWADVTTKSTRVDKVMLLAFCAAFADEMATLLHTTCETCVAGDSTLVASLTPPARDSTSNEAAAAAAQVLAAVREKGAHVNSLRPTDEAIRKGKAFQAAVSRKLGELRPSAPESAQESSAQESSAQESSAQEASPAQSHASASTRASPVLASESAAQASASPAVRVALHIHTGESDHAAAAAAVASNGAVVAVFARDVDNFTNFAGAPASVDGDVLCVKRVDSSGASFFYTSDFFDAVRSLLGDFFAAFERQLGEALEPLIERLLGVCVLLLAGGDCLQKLLDRHGVARLNKLGAKRLKECGAEEAVALRKRLALAVRACTAGPLNFNYDAMIAVARIFTEPSKAFTESLRLHCESYVPSRFAASRFNLRERVAVVMKAREPLLEVRLRALAQISQLAKLVTTPTPTPAATSSATPTVQTSATARMVQLQMLSSSSSAPSASAASSSSAPSLLPSSSSSSSAPSPAADVGGRHRGLAAVAVPTTHRHPLARCCRRRRRW
jgi:hypothetical protein